MRLFGKKVFYTLSAIAISLFMVSLISCLSTPSAETASEGSIEATAVKPEQTASPADTSVVNSTPETEQAAEVKTETIQELIKNGKSGQAKSLFQYSADVNSLDEDGNTALHCAAKINDFEMISFLLNIGAQSDLKNKDSDTPLHVAIKNDAKESAKLLAENGINIFAKDGNGVTALELASSKGSLWFPIIITEKTSQLKDAYGQTILHYFVKENNIEAVSYCITEKIPLSTPDSKGITPLAIAYANCENLDSIKIAANLLIAGASPLRNNFSYFEDSVKTRNPSLRLDDGQTPLHIAAILNQRGIVLWLLERGASTKAKDIAGSTPLHEAVRYGYPEIVRILLEKGADPNSQDNLGKTPLLLIIPAETRSKIYDLLLSYNANPNAKDMFGDTPLHIATMCGTDITVLEKLTQAGADIDERNKKGVTPLSLAVEHGRNEHIEFYARHNADIHAEDTEGYSPLNRALSKSLEMTSKLLSQSNISSRDSYGNTPLHIAVSINASIEQIKFLIGLKADINARNRNGDSSLYIAVQNNQKEIGELLLLNKADVFSTNMENFSPLRLALTSGGTVLDWILTPEVIKSTDGTGNTPLHYASEWQLDNAVSILLSKGANPNIQNANGETPLFNAVKGNSPSTIQLLVKNGATIDARDYLGNTPIHNCIRWDAQDAAKMLISLGAGINPQNLSGKTPLSEAARSGKIAMVSMLLDKNANINASDATGKTALLDAVQSNCIEIVQLLLDHGASPLIQEMYGRNAMHEAAVTGNINLINLIRKAGGNPLSRDTYGQTPFSLAIDKSPEIISAVLGSDRNLVDSDGNSPIHLAIMQDIKADKVELLISLGYPVTRRNREGDTPLTIAVEHNNIETVQLLLAKGADPFISNNSGECALTLALKEHPSVLNTIVENTGSKTDIQGEGILHYAACYADSETIKRLLSMGLDRRQRNISGETAYDIAIRWQRNEIAELLK